MAGKSFKEEVGLGGGGRVELFGSIQQDGTSWHPGLCSLTLYWTTACVAHQPGFKTNG